MFFGNRNLDEVIKFDMTNKQVEPIIKQKVPRIGRKCFQSIKRAYDKFGVTQPNIQLLGNSGRILVELPEPKMLIVLKIITSTAPIRVLGNL